MQLLISGASGLIGHALCLRLQEQGHEVTVLSRRGPSRPGTILWDPMEERVDWGDRPDFDAVVHLAGENIIGRWSTAKKRAILDSRVRGTRGLAKALSTMEKQPNVFLCASAVGYYGSRSGELDESSGPGTGFLADVCQAWEASASIASDADIRTVSMRFGVVLAPSGGAMAKMLPPFRLGLGGPMGDGSHRVSWISIQDVIEAVLFLLEREDVSGPVNMTAPHPVSNAHFTRALGQALGRPTFIPVPRFGLRILFGEMADEVLLADAAVIPKKLQECGFAFRHPRIEEAISAALKDED